MTAPPAQPPGQSSVGAAGKAADSQLLMDQVLPTYDVAVVHADVFRAPSAQCYRVASELDLFAAPLIRTLIGIRGLPQRVVSTFRGRGTTTTREASRRTFRLKDMVAVHGELHDTRQDEERLTNRRGRQRGRQLAHPRLNVCVSDICEAHFRPPRQDMLVERMAVSG
jgi:hypothetical protein